MLMMLALRLPESVQSLGQIAAPVRAFQGQEIGERGGKEMQLMLMMLALRLAEYVQSLGRIAPPAGGVPRPGDRRERWKGNAADADDARVAAR